MKLITILIIDKFAYQINTSKLETNERPYNKLTFQHFKREKKVNKQTCRDGQSTDRHNSTDKLPDPTTFPDKPRKHFQWTVNSFVHMIPQHVTGDPVTATVPIPSPVIHTFITLFCRTYPGYLMTAVKCWTVRLSIHPSIEPYVHPSVCQWVLFVPRYGICVWMGNMEPILLSSVVCANFVVANKVNTKKRG